MKPFFFIITLFLLFFSVIGQASEMQLGLSVGPALVRNADFNGANAMTGAQLMAGLSVDYPIRCAARFCEGLFIEPGFLVTLQGTSQFGTTRVGSTGVSGNYSESLSIYSGNLNLKKHVRIKSKFSAFALAGLGASYFKLSNIRFTDGLGEPLSLNVSESSLNLNLNLGAGLAYEAGSKILIDLKVVPHLVFPSITQQSYLTIPLGLHYAF